MRIILLLALLVSNLALAQETVPYSLAPYTFVERIKSCYRWVGEREFKKWQKEPYLQAWYADQLGRQSDKMTTFCWSNPVGAIMGAPPNEDYGDYLIRIDFVNSAVIYDRNTNTYLAVNEETPIYPNRQLGMDSEIVYENFYFKNAAWFQEYIVRSQDVIASWTFADQKLRNQFFEDLQRLLEKNFRINEMHFYCNFLNYPNAIFFESTGRPYYEDQLKKKAEKLKIFWAGQNANDLRINPSARK